MSVNINNFQFSINFVDFCRDSAKQASLLALTAPKVLNFQFTELDRNLSHPKDGNAEYALWQATFL
jgi:hypothetical protein